MRKFNLLAPELDRSSERTGYEWVGAAVGKAVGAEQISACLYELEAGQHRGPYHFHHGIEEWLLVVSGSPVVRTLEGKRELRAGDVLCFPAGPDGAHQVTGPGTVLIVAEKSAVEAIEYPDAGKIAVYPPGKIFRSADAVETWEVE
jgi:uncharacterized cupin superfamily protein